MEVVWFLLIGLAAGWLAGQLTKGSGFGTVGDLVIGVIGAILGGFLFRLVGIAAYGLLGQLIMATVGAVVLVVVLRDQEGLRRLNAPQTMQDITSRYGIWSLPCHWQM